MSSPVNVDILALRVVLVGVLGLDAEGMRTEVVTLSLQQVGRKVGAAVSVVEAEGSAEGRHWKTPQGSLADNVSPAVLGLVDGLVEEVIKQQVLQLGVLAVGIGDVLEEDGADDATATPHQGDGRLVQLPTVLLSRLH